MLILRFTMQRPVEEIMSPAEFIPIAEETGLIVPIGEWVLVEVCKQCKRWIGKGLPPITLSVHLNESKRILSGLFKQSTGDANDHFDV